MIGRGLEVDQRRNIQKKVEVEGEKEIRIEERAEEEEIEVLRKAAEALVDQSQGNINIEINEKANNVKTNLIKY